VTSPGAIFTSRKVTVALEEALHTDRAWKKPSAARPLRLSRMVTVTPLAEAGTVTTWVPPL
jgi:hypothetical protein